MERVLCGLGAPPAARSRLPWHIAGALVAEICLLRAAPCVGIRETHSRAFALADFLTAVVANEHGFSSHCLPFCRFASCELT